MEFDLSNKEEIQKAKIRFNVLLENKSTIELKQLKNNRTLAQNRSLHKLFQMVSFALNELGHEFNYTGVKGKILSTRYTPEIVKNFFWRPIQITLFDIQSTKDLNTQQINEIVDVIVKYFGEKGVVIEFPSKV